MKSFLNVRIICYCQRLCQNWKLFKSLIELDQLDLLTQVTLTHSYQLETISQAKATNRTAIKENWCDRKGQKVHQTIIPNLNNLKFNYYYYLKTLSLLCVAAVLTEEKKLKAQKVSFFNVCLIQSRFGLFFFKHNHLAIITCKTHTYFIIND